LALKQFPTDTHEIVREATSPHPQKPSKVALESHSTNSQGGHIKEKPSGEIAAEQQGRALTVFRLTACRTYVNKEEEEEEEEEEENKTTLMKHVKETFPSINRIRIVGR